ncbi:ABC transporter permease [Niallia taxi]|uniref:ABC transporter permease n=1 Tax=Niallia taxi TaxID=2499688 RepID=A0A3S2U9I3_9BACI|nr:ABC transporter permease [Niallia taxi]MCM3216579.1 ABC transporter permease [Niallia taxi]MED4038943.1 ABC transporter permease [Niallia taxi]MED4054019.1 ABC transporter permease [Niallia taxi]MED4118460.1 ABC transporter permease [Niallia taxi]RVT61522.1 ABC transporter permease [Niallia taxi]
MFLNIYLKELKDSFRDKRTLLLTVFLPIIIMTLLTLFYEKLVSEGEGESYQLAVAANLPEEIRTSLLANSSIELVEEKNPEEALQNGEAQAALLTDDNFANLVAEKQNAELTIIGDSFSQSSSTLMSLTQAALSQYESIIVSERLEALGVEADTIKPLSITQEELSEDPTINLVAMLIPLILAVAISVGAGPSAADFFSGEKEKKTMEALLMTPVNRSTLVFAKWLTISTIGTVTGIITLLVVVLEIAFLTENLKNAIEIGDNFGLSVILAIVLTIVYSMFIASLLMLTSIIGKTIKESQSYSAPIMMVTILPLMFMSNVGINELEFKHFAIPVMNIYSLLKELIFGITNFEHFFITIGSNLIVLVVVFFIGRIMFLKDKWVMN